VLGEKDETYLYHEKLRMFSYTQSKIGSEDTQVNVSCLSGSKQEQRRVGRYIAILENKEDGKENCAYRTITVLTLSAGVCWGRALRKKKPAAVAFDGGGGETHLLVFRKSNTEIVSQP